jgi:hypothetical protein
MVDIDAIKVTHIPTNPGNQRDTIMVRSGEGHWATSSVLVPPRPPYPTDVVETVMALVVGHLAEGEAVFRSGSNRDSPTSCYERCTVRYKGKRYTVYQAEVLPGTYSCFFINLKERAQ